MRPIRAKITSLPNCVVIDEKIAIPEFAANPFRLEKSSVSVWKVDPLQTREKTKT